jgi:D-alanine-D-alanine ligase
MNIIILHNAVASDDSPEDLDTLTQVAAVRESLCRLGHRADAVSCTLDLASVRHTLDEMAPDLVFNLVESLGGSDSLSYFAAALLDSMRIAYTGSSTEALFATNHKVIAKRTMRQAGLPTPDWMNVSGTRSVPDTFEPPCIIKAVWEHGSRGLDDENVVIEGDSQTVLRRLEDFITRTGRPYFAERFIEGREFNIPMLENAGGPQILPPGEMDFSTFPDGKPQIINHRAKWHEDSFEYNNTPRSFHIDDRDRDLVERLKQLALDCWRVFDLRGHVRIDFRVDRAGQPWILEVNTNPCLSPDAGYLAALEEAGLSYDEAVRRILDAALAGREANAEVRS